MKCTVTSKKVDVKFDSLQSNKGIEYKEEMSVKSIVLLLMLLTTQLQVAAPDDDTRGSRRHNCKIPAEPANCNNNSRIRISKSDSYQLMLCANNQCSESTVISFECDYICDACEATG